MKRAILFTLAAGVAMLPAVFGVAGNATFSRSIPASIPSGASVLPSVDDSGHNSDATLTPRASATASDRHGRGADNATPSATATNGDGGRGTDHPAYASATRPATSPYSTGADRGTGTQVDYGSGRHGGDSGGGGTGRR